MVTFSEIEVFWQDTKTEYTYLVNKTRYRFKFKAMDSKRMDTYEYKGVAPLLEVEHSTTTSGK